MSQMITCKICKRTSPQRQWCSATDIEYFTLPGQRFSYLECEECSTLRIAPVPLNLLKTIYPSSYYSYAGSSKSALQQVKAFLDRRMLRQLTNILKGHSLRALDVGGGTGELLDSLKSATDKFQHFSLIDLDADAGKIASKKGIQFYNCRVEDFKSNEQFDLVMIYNLIEHVDDPVFVLKQLTARLSPQGIIVLKTPNYKSLDANLFRHQSWAGLHCPRHWTLFSKKSFCAAASAAGLEVVKFSYTQGAPFWSASIVALLGRLGLADVSAQSPTPFHPLVKPLAALFAAFDFARAFVGFKTSQMYVVLRTMR